MFAALVESRPYKSSLAPPGAIARMRRLDGKRDAAGLTILERLVVEGDAARATRGEHLAGSQAGDPSSGVRSAVE